MMTDEQMNEFLESIGGLENGYFNDRPPIKSCGFFDCYNGWFPLIKELIENPSYDNFFVTLTFCQNPVLNLYNAIYSYDISNTTNPIQLSDYFEKTMFLDLIGNIGPDSILIDTSSGYP